MATGITMLNSHTTIQTISKQQKKKKTQMLQMFIKLFQYTDVAFLCQSVHTACLVKITFKHEFFLYRDLLNGQINQINPLTCIPSLLQCPLLVQSGLSVFILYKKKKQPMVKYCQGGPYTSIL